jgi:hypothetical protein
VIPFVRLIIPVWSAVIDLRDEAWVLRDPLVTASPPPGTNFPFQMDELCVFAQLTGGLGQWELGVEVRERFDNGTYRTVGTGRTTMHDFSQGPRLNVVSTAFPFRQIPFREEGLYEFRVIAQTNEDGESPTYEPLAGPVAELRVLHPMGAL